MSHHPANHPTSAYIALGAGHYQSSELTRGPWHPDHQHAGPPVALVCRAVEAAAREHGLTHIARLTANLLRPVPICELQIEVKPVYVGRNAAHFAVQLTANGKEVGVFTALAQRESEFVVPDGLPGHPLPTVPVSPDDAKPVNFPFAGRHVGYSDLMETRTARGHHLWWTLRHLVSHAPPPGGGRNPQRLPARGRGGGFGQRHQRRAGLRALQLRQHRPDHQPAAPSAG